jgi:hypothetical protein
VCVRPTSNNNTARAARSLHCVVCRHTPPIDLNRCDAKSKSKSNHPDRLDLGRAKGCCSPLLPLPRSVSDGPPSCSRSLALSLSSPSRDSKEFQAIGAAKTLSTKKNARSRANDPPSLSLAHRSLGGVGAKRSALEKTVDDFCRLVFFSPVES